MWDNWQSFQTSIYSQNNEDGILMAILDCLELSDKSIDGWISRSKNFVEVGVDFNQGKLECNSGMLIEREWNGILIDEDYFKIPGINFIQKFVTVDNFYQTIEDWFVNYTDRKLGFLSIDVDGNDYWLWKSLPESYQPSIVCIEYNPTIDPTKKLVIPYDPKFKWHVSDYFGASAGALVHLAHLRGYKLVTDTNHVNLFFVDEKLLPKNWIEPDLKSLGGAIGRMYPTDTRKYQEIR